jgi:2-polyprenyl-6-methoxyphenol hydroxylase-like FAD-dependent oxidoreductase
MSDQRNSAIVMGASIGGMLAARALSSHYKQVTIIDRDALPYQSALRKGAPQSGHAHGLLAGGYQIMDDYFPNLMPELESLGAQPGDVTGGFLWFQYGYWKLRHECGLRGITVSRPCLEAAVRRQMQKLPNVSFMAKTEVIAPEYDQEHQRVTGVKIRYSDRNTEDFLPANLVMDATGRGSHAPKWLDIWGYGIPKTVTVPVNVGYATRILERKPGDLFGSNGAVIAGTPPLQTQSCGAIAVEDNRWVLTLTGTRGKYPPSDEAGWAEFAKQLPTPVIYDLIQSCRPLSDITTYRFPTNQRRLYEKMKRHPHGFLVIGDAICSFNPVYGQGMTAAAMEARALDDTLAAGSDNIAGRFYSKVRKIVDIPWMIATGEDFRFAQDEIKRPRSAQMIDRYMDRLHAVASQDPVVCRKFFDVLNLLAAPPSLMVPSLAWRVLTSKVPLGQGSPWGHDVSSINRERPNAMVI